MVTVSRCNRVDCPDGQLIAARLEANTSSCHVGGHCFVSLATWTSGPFEHQLKKQVMNLLHLRSSCAIDLPHSTSELKLEQMQTVLASIGRLGDTFVGAQIGLGRGHRMPVTMLESTS